MFAPTVTVMAREKPLGFGFLGREMDLDPNRPESRRACDVGNTRGRARAVTLRVGDDGKYPHCQRHVQLFKLPTLASPSSSTPPQQDRPGTGQHLKSYQSDRSDPSKACHAPISSAPSLYSCISKGPAAVAMVARWSKGTANNRRTGGRRFAEERI